MGARYHLPLAQGGCATTWLAGASARDYGAPVSKPRVLLLDDEATTRTLLKIFLMSQPLELVEQADPVAALELLRREEFALLIVDYNMPQMTGLELVKQLRATEGEKKLPVILLTGDEDQALNVKARAIGVTDFLRKPVTPDQLKTTIAHRLGLPPPR
jgi:CheY-like chemotaxis protein